mgnify:CR=1 FL=1
MPPNETDRIGVFLFEEAELGEVRLQAGTRYEVQEVSSLALAQERHFDSLSGSVGLSWGIGERATLGLAAARSVKFPTAEELFSKPGIA